MTEEIAQLLKVMHLRRMAEILDEELAAAEKEQRSYQDLLARLLRAQWHAQQEKALAWRIDRARLPERWTLETFPFKKQPGISQKQIRGFAELDFIGKAENIRAGGADRSRQDRHRIGLAVEGATEWLPGLVCPGAGPLR
jgi:DNA replication protein DnaC